MGLSISRERINNVQSANPEEEPKGVWNNIKSIWTALMGKLSVLADKISEGMESIKNFFTGKKSDKKTEEETDEFSDFSDLEEDVYATGSSGGSSYVSRHDVPWIISYSDDKERSANDNDPSVVNKEESQDSEATVDTKQSKKYKKQLPVVYNTDGDKPKIQKSEYAAASTPQFLEPDTKPKPTPQLTPLVTVPPKKLSKKNTDDSSVKNKHGSLNSEVAGPTQTLEGVDTSRKTEPPKLILKKDKDDISMKNKHRSLDSEVAGPSQTLDREETSKNTEFLEGLDSKTDNGRIMNDIKIKCKAMESPDFAKKLKTFYGNSNIESMHEYITKFESLVATSKTSLNMDDSNMAMLWSSVNYCLDIINYSVNTGIAIRQIDISNINEALALLSELSNNDSDKDRANMQAISFCMRIIFLHDKNVDLPIDFIDSIEKMNFFSDAAEKMDSIPEGVIRADNVDTFTKKMAMIMPSISSLFLVDRDTLKKTLELESVNVDSSDFVDKVHKKLNEENKKLGVVKDIGKDPHSIMAHKLLFLMWEQNPFDEKESILNFERKKVARFDIECREISNILRSGKSVDLDKAVPDAERELAVLRFVNLGLAGYDRFLAARRSAMNATIKLQLNSSEESLKPKRQVKNFGPKPTAPEPPKTNKKGNRVIFDEDNLLSYKEPEPIDWAAPNEAGWAKMFNDLSILQDPQLSMLQDPQFKTIAYRLKSSLEDFRKKSLLENIKTGDPMGELEEPINHLLPLAVSTLCDRLKHGNDANLEAIKNEGNKILIACTLLQNVIDGFDFNGHNTHDKYSADFIKSNAASLLRSTILAFFKDDGTKPDDEVIEMCFKEIQESEKALRYVNEEVFRSRTLDEQTAAEFVCVFNEVGLNNNVISQVDAGLCNQFVWPQGIDSNKIGARLIFKSLPDINNVNSIRKLLGNFNIMMNDGRSEQAVKEFCNLCQDMGIDVKLKGSAT